MAQNHPELAWQVVETEHFRIFYHEGWKGRRRGGAHCRSCVRAHYQAVWIRARRSRADRAQRPRRLRQWRGLFYQDTIEIWTTSLDHDFDLRGSSDWLRNVITHEFAHIVSLGAARKGVQRVPALYLQYFGYQREKNRPDILIGYRTSLLPIQ